MAAASAESVYGKGAVYGSLAYDFDNPELYRDGNAVAQPGVRSREKAQTQTRTRVQTRAKAVARTRQSLAPLTLIGMLAAAFLLVVAILAQAQMVGISSRSVELQQELAELEERQAKLRIAYESAFNMAEIEDYAIHSLGMQKPRADQIYYIDTSSPDKAVVIAGGEDVGFVDRVSDYLSGVADLFR